MVNDSADVASSRRSFHVCGPAIGKARLPTSYNIPLHTIEFGDGIYGWASPPPNLRGRGLLATECLSYFVVCVDLWAVTRSRVTISLMSWCSYRRSSKW